MATASNRGRSRGRARAGKWVEDVPEVVVFGDPKFLRWAKDSTDEDSGDDSKEPVTLKPIYSEERKKKLDLLVYKYMARQLMSGLREHRLEQLMQKYLNLDDDEDGPPAAPPPSASGSPIDGAKQAASDQPSPTATTSRRPFEVCETMNNSPPSSLIDIEETAVNPKVVQDIIPDITERHAYIGRGRGRGNRYDANKRLQGRGIRFN